MLKIAEYNTITGEKIDLKELEKFGFELIEDCYIPNGLKVKIIDCYVKPNKQGEFNSLCIFIKTGFIREISAPIYDLKTLYDLIQAGIVEKVEEVSK